MTTPNWDLTIAYSGLDDEKIEQDISLINQVIELLDGQVSQRETVAVMQNAILSYEAASKLLSTLYTYGNCQSSTDASNAGAKALVGRMSKVSTELQQAFSPYELTLTHAEESFVLEVLNHESDDVSQQAFNVSELRRNADTMLSVEEEQLLTAMTVDGKHAWNYLYDNLTGSLKVDVNYEDGTSETLGFSQAASILYGSEFDKQEAVWRGIQEAMKTHQESFASILNALSGWRLTEYKKRSTKREVSFLEPALNSSRIEEATLNSMMKVTKDRIEVGRKANKLMARIRGQEELKPWSYIGAMPPFGTDAKVYSYDEAIEVITKAFAEVDQEMADFVTLMVENNWIDAAPSPNKRLGAYCTKLAATRTPLVFMTWGGSRSDLMTLAHELGHAFHNWVMRDMPACKSSYPMTLAETASIFAENIVRDYLLENVTSVEEKLEMLWEELSSVSALMVNIPVRFEFEKAFYEQRKEGQFTADQFCELMTKTWQDWYGDSMTESDPYFWASKLHFAISGVSFYNYPYLFGFLFSKGIYAQREEKGAEFYSDYVSLLRDTGAMRAEDVVMKHLGMDLREETFWKQSIDIVSEKIDEFERLLDQR